LDNDSCWLAAISFVSRMKEQWLFLPCCVLELTYLFICLCLDSLICEVNPFYRRQQIMLSASVICNFCDRNIQLHTPYWSYHILWI
jgi:hypothetical protein